MQVIDLDLEYALFNAARTLSTPEPSTAERCRLGLIHRDRPAADLTNRIVGLDEDELGSLGDLLARYEAPPRIDVRREDCTSRVSDELRRRGFQQTGALCFLTRGVEPATEAARHDIRRWGTEQADAFLDLLGLTCDETRAAKRHYYCTERFRVFVAHVDSEPVGWATMFVTDDGKHGYLANAFTHPDHRGRGIQRDLLTARLRDGAAIGLEGFVVDVVPETTSQRNCERVGFRVVAVHTLWTRPS